MLLEFDAQVPLSEAPPELGAHGAVVFEPRRLAPTEGAGELLVGDDAAREIRAPVRFAQAGELLLARLRGELALHAVALVRLAHEAAGASVLGSASSVVCHGASRLVVLGSEGVAPSSLRLKAGYSAVELRTSLDVKQWSSWELHPELRALRAVTLLVSPPDQDRIDPSGTCTRFAEVKTPRLTA